MTIDLVTLANLVALSGCTFLLVFWIVVSRKMMGFLYTVAGCIIILVAMRSDHQVIHLMGMVIAALVILGLLVAGNAALAARRRSHGSARASRLSQQSRYVPGTRTPHRAIEFPVTPGARRRTR
jgi:hypothetical protein